MNTILLQLERLRRHYEIAVRSYDHVSLLDLSHSLRIWTELKQPLVKLSPNFSTSIAFKTGLPAKKIFKAARGSKFVFSYMPGGVKTYASNGHLASGPEIESSNRDFSIGISVKISPPLIELGNYCFISKGLDDSLVKALGTAEVKRLNYIQWLAAEAVRVSYINKNQVIESIAISREMIIKRVANTLDGSHPSAADGDDIDNNFDAPVHYLLQYKMGGLPLPYFILLKIAQDILEIAPRLLGLNTAENVA